MGPGGKLFSAAVARAVILLAGGVWPRVRSGVPGWEPPRLLLAGLGLFAGEARRLAMATGDCFPVPLALRRLSRRGTLVTEMTLGSIVTPGGNEAALAERADRAGDLDPLRL